jgi:glutamate N-acetyltransferase / amino-acid N-acetyltransferase
MEFHPTPQFPRGFRCASRHIGIKREGRDLAVFFSDAPAAAAAVFTRNRFPGAPIVVGRETIRGGSLRAIVVNSRVSNVGTGERGIRDARRTAEIAATELGIAAVEVLVSSTGVIGVPLPMDRMEAGLPGIASELQDDPLVGASGIMTTDTYAKAVSLRAGDATITLVGKGSGMIEPNMATMLVYIFTDARIDAPSLDRLLRDAVDDTFNMLSIDTDTSTSDTCAILANGLAGPVAEGVFREALRAGCLRMTEMLARDGEGASKLLRSRVSGAATREDARTVAKSIINSPLVKTMAFGADPNVGRLLMAIGKCFDAHIDADRTDVWIDEIQVVESGRKAEFDENEVRERLRGDPVELRVDLGVGEHAATAFGCDLTHGYVEENAAYYSS